MGVTSESDSLVPSRSGGSPNPGNGVNFKFGWSNKVMPIWGRREWSDLAVCGGGGGGGIDLGVGKDAKIKKCVELGLMWSAVVNAFGQTLATPLMGNKMFPAGANAGGDLAPLKSGLRAVPASLAYKTCSNKDTSSGDKGERHVFLDISVSRLFDHVCQSLHKFHLDMIENGKDVMTGEFGFVSVTSLKVEENRLIQNVRFAKIGVRPTSSVMEVAYVSDENQSESVPRGKLETNVVHRTKVSESESSSVEAAAQANEQTENVFKSALAGGFSCALSAFIMHPVDTVKTQVQASTLSLPEIISKLPQIGTQGLYRGIVPAVVGQFSSHGLRTGICEIVKFVLVNVAPTMPDLQVESVSSFCGTILGTTTRIPSEVIKQRLQAGLYKNLGEAIIGTWKQDGLKAFFRGTGATLCREIPFYVAGMGLYSESKKVVQKLIGRQLEPWEIIVVGAVAGGLAAVTTTPFDVIKTRMMIATGGSPESMSALALSILKQEGPLGLFKGAVPRFFWVAPLGAMNFAGYELARKALG